MTGWEMGDYVFIVVADTFTQFIGFMDSLFRKRRFNNPFVMAKPVSYQELIPYQIIHYSGDGTYLQVHLRTDLIDCQSPALENLQEDIAL
jgi:hypothetical protein